MFPDTGTHGADHLLSARWLHLPASKSYPGFQAVRFFGFIFWAVDSVSPVLLIMMTCSTYMQLDKPLSFFEDQ